MPRIAIWQQALAVALILVIFAAAGCGSSTHTQTPAATATTRSASTATRASIPNFPLAGWLAGGPASATAIAFAPGSSSVAYACGTTTPLTAVTGGVAPIYVSVSTDGARTWTMESPNNDASASCSLSVNPTNALDIALFITNCAQGCDSDPKTHLYRTQDGGKSWGELILPELPADGAGFPYFTNALAWSGNLLIAETEANVPGGRSVHHLVAGANVGQLARIDQAAVFSGAGIGRVFTLGTGIYAPIFPAGCTGAYFCMLAKTTNGGATWQQVSLRYQSQAVDLLATSSGAIIVGTPAGAIEHAQIARTTNDGLAWQALPATPAGLAYYVAPDGTLFLTALNSGALYRLAPGAQQWQLVVSSPVPLPTGLDDGSLVFQYDAAGHPVAVWRDAGQDQSNNGAQYPGLQYHAL